MSKIEIIARTLGYYYYDCTSDAEAIRAGWDAAVEVMAALGEL